MNALRVALRIFSGKIILNFAFVALCGALQTLFSREGSWRQTAFAAPLSTKARRCGGKLLLSTSGLNPLRLCFANPPPPKGEVFEITAKFFIAFDALKQAKRRAPSPSSLRDATSPKGRGKGTAGNFLIAPKTLATSFRPWLSLRESWRGSA